MTASQTIDTTAYLTNDIGTKSASKSYADHSSCEFENIFEDINKSYSSSDKSSSKNKSNQDTKSNNNYNDGSIEKKSDNSKETYNNDKNKVDTESSASTNDTQNETIEKDSCSKSNTNDNNLKDDKTQNKSDKNKNNEINQKQQSDEEVSNKSVQINNSEDSNSKDTKIETETSELINLNQENSLLDEIITQAASENNTVQADNKNSTETESNQAINPKTNEKTQNSEFEQVSENIKVSNNTQIDLITPEEKSNSEVIIENSEYEQVSENTPNNNTNDNSETKTLNNNPMSIKVGIENVIAFLNQLSSINKNSIKSIDNNPNIEQNETLIKILNQTKTNQQTQTNEQITNQYAQKLSTNQSTNPDQTINIQQNQNADVEIPMIKVATESIASTSNKEITNTNDAQNVKNILNKTSLNQEALDKLNAKIISVEKSSSNDAGANSNLQNKQSAQEQIVKIQLENISDAQPDIQAPAASKNIDLTLAKDVNTQINYVSNSTQTQTTTQAPREINQNEIISQINKHIEMKNLQNEGATKINIILKPENLGRINLELVNSKEGLTAQLTTNNAQVKEILDKNIDSLKDSLGTQGINVNNVNVKLNETQKQSNDDMLSFLNQNGQEQQQSSNNSKQSSENKISLNKEAGDHIDNSDEEIELETENSEINLSANNLSSIDYKI